MLQTRDGFLWIGTRGGLARFDGAAFVTYKSGVSNSIPSDSVNSLAEAPDGGLWIATNGGLTRYQNGHFETFSGFLGLPDTAVWRIAADPAGGIWAVTRNSELFHFDGKKAHRYESSFQGRAQDVNALTEDSSGTLWIATFHGLFSFRGGREIRRFGVKEGLAGDRVYALALDHDGQVWTAGDGGLSHASALSFISIHVPHLSTATLLAFDPDKADGAVWTGATGKGLFRFSRNGLERLHAAQGLVSDEQYLLYFSRDGSLWLGALNGLNELSESPVTSFATTSGWPRSTLDVQRSQGPEGELWFAIGSLLYQAQEGGLLSLGSASARKSSASFATTRSRLLNFRAVPLWIRSNDRSSRGLVLTDGHNHSLITDGAVERALPNIPWSSVGSMLIDENGTVWTAGSEIGVVAYPVHGAPRSFTTANGLSDNNVLALTEDTAGSLWIGTIAGLDRIRDGVVSHILATPNVNAIDPSADGSLWAGAESGLLYVPPLFGTPQAGPVRLFQRREDLPASAIEGVAQTKEGYLWLGTEQGVVRIAKASLLAPDSHALSPPVVFGSGDGLHSAQVRINSVFRSRSGEIWFQTLGGLASIDPHRILAKPLATIVMDRVQIDGRDVTISSSLPLVVPSGRHRLTFHYTLPEFRSPSRIRFRYRLEGWDKQWIEAGDLREATYTGIPPGHYTFQVANSDGYGSWTQTGKSLPMEVEPNFYETRRFLGAAASLVAFAAFQLHRLRVARVRNRLDARIQERTRIARELHDTLLQGVLGVSMQMYAASHQSSPNSVRAMLSHASQRLREIAEQSRQAVGDLRSPVLPIDSFERSLANQLHEMDLPDGMNPNIYCAGLRAELKPAVQTQVERIAKEAIANAVQHSGADLIRVDILYQTTHLFVSISDNGHGIDSASQGDVPLGHWGIAGMRERAESIGACLRILPNSPRGTVVEVSLSEADAYLHVPEKGWRLLKYARLWRQRRVSSSPPELL